MKKIGIGLIIMIISILFSREAFSFNIKVHFRNNGDTMSDSRLVDEQITTHFEDWSDLYRRKIPSPFGTFVRNANVFPQTPIVFHRIGFGNLYIYKLMIYASGRMMAYSDYLGDKWYPSETSEQSYNITNVAPFTKMKLEINGKNNLFSGSITLTYDEDDMGWPMSLSGNYMTYLIMGESSYQQQKSEEVIPAGYSRMEIRDGYVKAETQIDMKQMPECPKNNKKLIIKPDPGYIAVEKSLEFRAYWQYEDGMEVPADAELWDVGAGSSNGGSLSNARGVSTKRKAGMKPEIGTISAKAEGKTASASRIEYKVTYDEVGYWLDKNKTERQFTTLSENDIIYAAGSWDAAIYSKPDPGLEKTDGTLVWSRDDSDKRLEGIFDPNRHQDFRWTKFTPADTYTSDSNNNRIKVEYYDGHNNGMMYDTETCTMIVIPEPFWYFVPELQSDSKWVQDIYNAGDRKGISRYWAKLMNSSIGDKSKVDVDVIKKIINQLVDNTNFDINKNLMKKVLLAIVEKESYGWKPHVMPGGWSYKKKKVVHVNETAVGMTQTEDNRVTTLNNYINKLNNNGKNIERIKFVENTKDTFAVVKNVKELAKQIIIVFEKDERWRPEGAIRVAAYNLMYINKMSIEPAGYLLGDNRISAEILACVYNRGEGKLPIVGISPNPIKGYEYNKKTGQNKLTKQTGFKYEKEIKDNKSDKTRLESDWKQVSKQPGFAEYEKNLEDFHRQKLNNKEWNELADPILTPILKEYIKFIGDKYDEYSK